MRRWLRSRSRRCSRGRADVFTRSNRQGTRLHHFWSTNRPSARLSWHQSSRRSRHHWAEAASLRIVGDGDETGLNTPWASEAIFGVPDGSAPWSGSTWCGVSTTHVLIEQPGHLVHGVEQAMSGSKNSFRNPERSRASCCCGPHRRWASTMSWLEEPLAGILADQFLPPSAAARRTGRPRNRRRTLGRVVGDDGPQLPVGVQRLQRARQHAR